MKDATYCKRAGIHPMKPNFVLNLSHDGIGVLHRAIDGWHPVGDVRLDDPEFIEKLGFLRQTAASLDKKGITSKLVIPNSEILYTEMQAPGPSESEIHAQISAALDQLTPYSVDELAYDFRVTADGVQVAAVAKETLAEAEAFATEHGFNPISFIAIPTESAFEGEPFFGMTSSSDSILQGLGNFERDMNLIKVVQAPKVSEQPVKEKPAAIPTPEPELKVAAKPETPKEEPEPEIELPAFSSRRDTDSDTPPNATLDRIDKIATRFALAPDTANSKAPKLGGAKRSSDTPKEEDGKSTGKSSAKKEPSLSKTAPEPSKIELKPAPKPPVAKTDTAADKPAKKPRLAKPNLKLGFGRKAKDVEKPAKVKAAVIPAAPKKSRFKKKRVKDVVTNPDEAEALTVFGERKGAEQRGKPRFLGLILMLLLVAVLLGVAFWSTYFLDDVSRLWRDTDDPPAAVQTADADQTTPPITAPPSLPSDSVSSAVAALSEPITQPKPIDPTQAPTDLPPSGTEAQVALLEDTTELELEPEPQTISEAEPNLFETAAPQPPAPITPEVAQAFYDDTGIWQLAPAPASYPQADEIQSLYITSIDPKTRSHDAVALPRVSLRSNDVLIAAPHSPAAASTRFVLDSRGLVIPSKEGTMNADGILVYAGPPPSRPGIRPAIEQQITEIPVGPDPRLAGFRPKFRPNDLQERNERASLGGYTRAQLAKMRPKARPIAPKAEKELDETPTAQAIAVSSPPSHRPKRFAALVKKALEQAARSNPSESATATVGVPRSQTVTPRIPTRASVARRATVKRALNLRRVNLIGVYGKSSARKALVRLPSGRYVNVKVGQRVDGGKVAAIGESTLKYVKGGRTITLKMPKT